MRENDEANLSLIEDSAVSGRAAIDRVSVYADAYFLRLKEILESDFELARAWIGEDPFTELAADYLRAHPPSSPNAARVGLHLADFVAVSDRWRPILLLEEIVRLEWGTVEAIFEKGQANLDSDKLGALSRTDLADTVFETDRSVRFVRSAEAVEDLWLGREDLSATLESLPAPLVEKPWIVLRRGTGQGIRFHRFSEGEKRLWDEVSCEQTLTGVCERIGEDESAIACLGGLGDWARLGLIKDFRQASSSGNDEGLKKEILK